MQYAIFAYRAYVHDSRRDETVSDYFEYFFSDDAEEIIKFGANLFTKIGDSERLSYDPSEIIITLDGMNAHNIEDNELYVYGQYIQNEINARGKAFKEKHEKEKELKRIREEEAYKKFRETSEYRYYQELKAKYEK